MRRSLAAVVLATIVGSLWAQAEMTEPAETPEFVSALAADSLVNSAGSLLTTPGAQNRGARLVALAEFARELDPRNVDACRVLADVYLIQGDSAGAAEMLRICVDASPSDSGLWMQWMASSLFALQTAEDRLEFLDSVVRDETLPRSVRAEATVQYVEVLIGHGQQAEAEGLFANALKLDPYHAGALQGWVEMQGSISVVDSANVMFRTLRGSPLDANVAHDLGVLMGEMGLWRDSLKFFDHAWALAVRDMGIEAIPAIWAAEYANALVDAGQLQRVVDIFTPLLEQYPNSVDILSLLAEANLGLGLEGEAMQLVESIEKVYGIESDGDLTSYDIEKAMFYLTTKPNTRLADVHAKAALQNVDAEVREASAVLQRILGGAELRAGSVDSGVARLRRVQGVDIYASVFLAAHHFAAGEIGLGQQAILTGSKVSRSGPAFRRLEAMAREHDVSIPPVAGAAQVSRMALDFNDLYLEIGLHPERFVEVSIVPPERPFAVGEPMVLTMEIRNIGPLAIPIGPGGLFEPVAALQVELTGPWEEPKLVTSMALVVWPAPQRLARDQVVRRQVRLDTGRLGALLAAHPLDEISVTVSGIVDPVQRGDDLSGSLANVGMSPVTVTRQSVMKAADGGQPGIDAFRDAMSALDAAADADSIRPRAQAARQAGALLALLARIDAGQTDAPPEVPLETMRSRLVQVQLKLMEDDSHYVRAEMVHSLILAGRGDRVLVLRMGLTDQSPLVRLRTAELLGTLEDQASREMLFKLADDLNPLVAEMATIFLSGQSAEDENDSEDQRPTETGSPQAAETADESD